MSQPYGATEGGQPEMASLYDITKGEDVELYRILSQAGFDAEMARTTIKQPELADSMVGALREQLAPIATGGRFGYLLSVEKQLDILRGYDHYLWGGCLEPEGWLDIDTSSDHVQSLDDLEILYVDFGSPQKNFANWYKVLDVTHLNVWRSVDLKTDEMHLRLGSNTHQYAPGIHRIRINLVANWLTKDRSVLEVREQAARSGEFLAHCEVLAAYAMHGELLKQMDGTKLPFAFLAGFETTVPGSVPWTRVPCLAWDRIHRKVRLDAWWAGLYNSYWGSPVVTLS
jgi:hypothetical protein